MASRQLEKKLDLIFSKYIRLRDSDNGVFFCCSCGALKPEQQMDAGHFISRKWRNTRWREDNVHGQCRADNRFGNGEAAGYAMFMIKKYGLEHVEMLHQLSRKTAKFTDSELEDMIKKYKALVKEMSDAQKTIE
jgi:hypothetical protein